MDFFGSQTYIYIEIILGGSPISNASGAPATTPKKRKKRKKGKKSF